MILYDLIIKCKFSMFLRCSFLLCLQRCKILVNDLKAVDLTVPSNIKPRASGGPRQIFLTDSDDCNGGDDADGRKVEYYALC